MILLYCSAFSCVMLVLACGSVSLLFSVGLAFSLTIDSSALTFLFTLLSISVSVLTWSYYYMDSDLAYRRFSSLILLFLGSIFALVLSADILSLLVAWDLLGFTSFFLVIYFRSRASLAGGLLTGITNRVGDVFLMALFGLVRFRSSTSLSCYLYILFLISFTKSAQVPFSSWLPSAMLAPTPVSALVHSSTLVTAGVYLLYRYLATPSTLLVAVGLFTTLVAGLAASCECDVKKIIALSTLSQLGLIVTSLGLGERSLCFAHLNTHAAFKALLFLAVGTSIHMQYGSQELRSAVPLSIISPFLIIILVTARASMCGFVFLSGWVSKEAILESWINSGLGALSLFTFYLGVGLTIIYSLRLAKSLFLTSSHMGRLSTSCSGPSWVMASMLYLFGLSILQGTTFDLNCSCNPAILGFLDKIMVWGVLLLRICFSQFLTRNDVIPCSPFTHLCLTTSFLRRSAVPTSVLHATEVQAFHGGGLALLPSLGSPVRVGSHLFNKFRLSLFVAVILL